MSDWQIGDLALCVRVTGKNILRRAQGHRLIVPGGVYTVEAVIPTPLGLSLRLAGAYSTTQFRGWLASPSFIKVTPPKADEFDRETIELMERNPVGESVQ